VQVEQDFQFFDDLPECAIPGQVVVDHGFERSELREPMHEGSLEPEILDAPLQLQRGLLWILHWQRREAREPIRALANLLCKVVVDTPSCFNGASSVVHGLDTWGIDGQDHDFDIGPVHQS
jgi:hypothetical protein